MRFSSSLLLACAPLLTQAWRRDETFTSGMSQDTYLYRRSLYEKTASFIAQQTVINLKDSQGNSIFKSQHEHTLPSVDCGACQAGMALVDQLLRSSFGQIFTTRFLEDACWLAVFAISHEECALTVDEAVPVVMEQCSEFLITPTFVCEQMLHYCDTSFYHALDPDDYAANLLKYKPSFLENNNYIDFLYKELAYEEKKGKDRKTLDLIQFTDMHVDLDYTIGSSINCGSVLCCRADFGMPTDPSDQAGPYGAIGFCDIPVSVLDKMTEKINELSPDAVFWTGDVPPHDMWNYSQEYEETYQKWFFNYLQANMTNQQIYPLEGNHDFGQVINSQDFSNTDPIIDLLAEQWSAYLSPSAIEKFKVNGFYTETFKTADGTLYENTKIIAINTEACYNLNFYLLADRNDPGGILAWLESELLNMEANGQNAILMGHHPPADNSCIHGWAKRFQAMMDRFQNVVRFSFFGHVHIEEHNLLRSYTNKNSTEIGKPIGVNYWSGSLTTYHDTYPTFRRFILDAELMIPIRVETWKLDVNQNDPVFELDHEVTEFYNMTDLSPSSFQTLADQILDDEELALKFHNVKRQYGPLSVDTCDESCRLQASCEASQSTYIDVKLCQGEPANSLIHDPVGAFSELMLDPWYDFSWVEQTEVLQ